MALEHHPKLASTPEDKKKALADWIRAYARQEPSPEMVALAKANDYEGLFAAVEVLFTTDDPAVAAAAQEKLNKHFHEDCGCTLHEKENVNGT